MTCILLCCSGVTGLCRSGSLLDYSDVQPASDNERAGHERYDKVVFDV